MNRLLIAIVFLLNVTIIYAQTSDGEDVCIGGLEKSLGVNMRFRITEGWQEELSRMPHVVKSYYNLKYGLVFNIVIQEARTFMSRNEFRNAVDEYHRLFEDQFRNDPTILYHSELSYDVVSVDQYPFMVTCAREQLRNSDKVGNVLRYSTVYEDRFMTISFFNYSTIDIRLYQPFINEIINSIVFPDQYLTY